MEVSVDIVISIIVDDVCIEMQMPRSPENELRTKRCFHNP